MNLSGPDVPEIQCYTPDGCCGPTPCDVTLEDFVCQIRSLLPEGQIFNNTLIATDPALGIQATSTILICENMIGSASSNCGEQLILGGCCNDDAIFCRDYPIAPQLAVVDSFSAAGFGAVEALCVLLRELDPCRAQLTIRLWAARYGITFPDPCEGEWPENILALLICIYYRLRFMVPNWANLEELAALFGARITLRYAGQFDCPEEHPTGWWTMARDGQQCPPKLACPDDPIASYGELIPLVPTCYGPLLSLNIIMRPGERIFPANCNLPPVPSPQPHDPEYYEAFKWLLPQVLPRNAFWCIYQQDLPNCIQ